MAIGTLTPIGPDALALTFEYVGLSHAKALYRKKNNQTFDFAIESAFTGLSYASRAAMREFTWLASLKQHQNVAPEDIHPHTTYIQVMRVFHQICPFACRSFCAAGAPQELLNNYDFIYGLVSEYGPALQHASQSLRSNKRIVLAAVSENGNAIQYMDASLRLDREIAVAAVKRHGHVLKFLPDQFRSDKEIVLAAVSSYGFAICMADPNLRQDKELAIAAVASNQYVMRDLSDTLQRDPDVQRAEQRGRRPDPGLWWGLLKTSKF